MQKDYLWSYSFVVDDDCLWLVPYWYNFLCKYNMRTEEIELIEKIPVENTSEALYSNLLMMDTSIILIPTNATKVCIYDTLKKEFTVIDVVDQDGKANRFFPYGVWGDCIYMFSLFSSTVIKFQVSLKKIDYISMDCGTMGMRQGDVLFQTQSYFEQERVYIPFWRSNRVLKFDMEKEVCTVLEIGEDDEYYLSVGRGNENELYLLNQDGNVVIYNELSGKTERLINKLNGVYNYKFFKEYACFASCVSYEGEVYFFPGSKVIKVNCRTHEIREADFSNVLLEDGERNAACFGHTFSMLSKVDSCVYIENMYSRNFMKIDMERGIVKSYKIPLECLPEEYVDEMNGQYQNVCREGALYLQLDNILKRLVSHQKEKKKEEMIGVKINDFIKGKMM